MRFVYTGLALYAASFGMFATGHVGAAILCGVLGTLVIMGAHEKEPKLAPAPPRRMIEDIDEETGEVMGWREVMAEVSTHVAVTGCLCTQADFTDPRGECPYGGTYSEHPAK